jgi:FecR-like protein
MKSIRSFAVVFFALSAFFFAASVQPALAQYQPAQASVRAIHGSASYSIGGNWQSLKENTTLAADAIVKTAPDTTLDLFLPDSRTVLRLMPSSVLRFDRLDKTTAGEVGVTITRLSLLSGTLIGSQHKLVRPSEFEVGLPNGVAKIVGTEYSLQADGTVACLKGTVSVAYNPSGNGPSVNVSVPAGFSSDPATCKTAAISTAYLQNIAPDVQAVRNNDTACNAGQTTTVVPDGCFKEITPTHDHHNKCGHDDRGGHDNKGGYDNGDGGW